MSGYNRITELDGHIATIRDTGITVHDVVVASLAGTSLSDILAQSPQLEADDVHQALSYTVQRQSMARVNSLQELRPEIATISGYGDLFLVGLRSDQLTSRQIAKVIVEHSHMLNYKCVYQIVRARLLNPWFVDIDWGQTSLARLQTQLQTYLTPNVDTVEYTLEATNTSLKIDSRLIPIIGFLTQGYEDSTIGIKQIDGTVSIDVQIPNLPADYAPLSQVEQLAQVILKLLDSELVIISDDDLVNYQFTVATLSSG
ncbi:MAG: DUF433 domain-containing protein [Chloroflexota bacterium]